MLLIISRTLSYIKKNTGIVLFFTVLCGCTSPRQNYSGILPYTKVLDSASHMYDANKTEQAIHYLDSATRNYNDITPAQWFRYYTYHYNYFYFIYDNKYKAML